MKKLFISLIISFILLKTTNLYAINNNQYYEIDFTYQNIINGKAYIEEAVLLRDKAWLKQNNITKAGDALILNIPEFGVVNAKATAKEVKSTNLNPESYYTKDKSMVTGTFKHYSINVREYTLKDIKNNQVQTIQATPNHAFYVSNRTAFNKSLNQQSHFIEIQNITPADKLINEAGNEVQLICNDNICGKQLVTNNKPIAVYNLEIFKQHQYLVFTNKSNNTYINNISLSNAILVHNNCAPLASFDENDDIDIDIDNPTQERRVHIENSMLVFRAEARQPDDVFANGLQGKVPVTDNVRILEHVYGAPSGYVSTSTDIGVPTEFVLDPQNREAWGMRKYIYLLRANPENSFDARLSVEAAGLEYHNVLQLDCREVCIEGVAPEDIIGYFEYHNYFEYTEETIRNLNISTTTDQELNVIKPYSIRLVQQEIFHPNDRFDGNFPDNTPPRIINDWRNR